MKVLFWLSIFFLLYTYFGYPLFMSILTKVKKTKPINKKFITPYISIVISAYNEEKNIGAKLNDIINIAYPHEKMEIFVISDASTDGTDEIVKGYSDRGVKLLRLEKRSGKIAAYHKIFPYLKGEIIVFSDAASLLHRESITNLISNFNDESVGCVGGLLAYISLKDAIVGKGEKKYWGYEKKIRLLESELSSLTSVSGTLYAVRKFLLPNNIKDYLADDLIVPFSVKKAGYRVLLEPEATCYDYTTSSIQEEMLKRIRITVQNIRGLIDQSDILNPFKYGLYSILVISHKLFRLMVPIFLLLIFISTLFLSFTSWIFMLLLVSQIIFYVGGGIGYLVNKRAKFSLGNSLFYFCLSNLAILIGIIRYLRGKKFATWETVRA